MKPWNKVYIILLFMENTKLPTFPEKSGKRGETLVTWSLLPSAVNAWFYTEYKPCVFQVLAGRAA